MSMKKIILILSIVAGVVLGCNDDKSSFTEEYDQLMTQNDSIEQVHNQFRDTHHQMLLEHDELAQQLESTEVEDSTVFEDMAQHEVILKKHEALLAGHGELIQGHEELKNNFGNLSTDEMRVQISEMKNNHDKIQSDQKEMRDEHDQLMKEHANLRDQIMSANINAGRNTSN